MSETGCDWWWRVKPTGKEPAFDVEATRERVCQDDTNPKGSMFFAAPGKERFES